MKYVYVRKTEKCKEVYEELIKCCRCVQAGKVDYCMIPNYKFDEIQYNKCIKEITEETYFAHIEKIKSR